MNIKTIKINEKGAIRRFVRNAVLQIKLNPIPFVLLLSITMACSYLLQMLPFGKNTIQVLVEIFLFVLLLEMSYSNSPKQYSLNAFNNSIKLVLDFCKKLFLFRWLSISIIIGISILFDLFSLGSSDIKSSEMMRDPNFKDLINFSLAYTESMKLFSIYIQSFALFVLFFQKNVVSDDYYNYRQQGGLNQDRIVVENPSNIVNSNFIMKLRYPFLFLSLIMSAIPVFGLLMSFIIMLMMMEYTYETYQYENIVKKKNLKLVKK